MEDCVCEVLHCGMSLQNVLINIDILMHMISLVFLNVKAAGLKITLFLFSPFSTVAMATTPSPLATGSSSRRVGAGAAMGARAEVATGAVALDRVGLMGSAGVSSSPGGLPTARPPATAHPHPRATASRPSTVRGVEVRIPL